ncbi:hypothetical protein HDU67_005792 [Dinochytrium kinnereticum]|nr:hypothetical protein HDU67_005792 [Dinochytrium kinnereticum]
MIICDWKSPVAAVNKTDDSTESMRILEDSRKMTVIELLLTAAKQTTIPLTNFASKLVVQLGGNIRIQIERSIEQKELSQFLRLSVLLTGQVITKALIFLRADSLDAVERLIPRIGSIYEYLRKKFSSRNETKVSPDRCSNQSNERDVCSIKSGRHALVAISTITIPNDSFKSEGRMLREEAHTSALETLETVPNQEAFSQYEQKGFSDTNSPREACHIDGLVSTITNDNDDAVKSVPKGILRKLNTTSQETISELLKINPPYILRQGLLETLPRHNEVSNEQTHKSLRIPESSLDANLLAESSGSVISKDDSQTKPLLISEESIPVAKELSKEVAFSVTTIAAGPRDGNNSDVMTPQILNITRARSHAKFVASVSEKMSKTMDQVLDIYSMERNNYAFSNYLSTLSAASAVSMLKGSLVLGMGETGRLGTLAVSFLAVEFGIELIFVSVEWMQGELNLIYS